MPTAGDNAIVRMKSTKVMDDGEFQKIQGSGRKNEVFGKDSFGMMRVQNYGMTAHPPTGSVGHSAAMGGNPDSSMFGFMEHPKYRPKNLAEGDVMFYTKHNAGEGEDRKDYMKFTENDLTISHAKKIIIKVGSSTITVEPNKITLQSDRIDLNP